MFMDRYSLVLLAILNILQCYRLVYHRTRTVPSVFLVDRCEYLLESELLLKKHDRANNSISIA